MDDEKTQYFDPGPPGYCWLTGYRFTYKQADQQRRRRKNKDAARKREEKEKEKQQQQSKL